MIMSKSRLFTKSKARLLNKYHLARAYNKRICDFPGSPGVINIEVSGNCNLGCPMCGRADTINRKTGMLPFEIFKKLVDETCEYTELYVLHNAGEPLLNRELPRMVAYAAEKNAKTMFSTNATLLSKERGVELIEAGVDIVILAIDGITKQVYEKIRVGADFDEVMNNVKEFIQSKKDLSRSNPFVVVQLIEMDENKEEISAFKKFWSGFPVQCFIKPSTEWHKTIDVSGRKHCDRLWYQSVVLDNGNVIPCCEDVNGQYCLGNIKDQSFSDIWCGPKISNIRRVNIEKNDDFALCRECNYLPPRNHTLLTDMAQCVLDFGTLAKILYKLGYKKKSQR